MPPSSCFLLDVNQTVPGGLTGPAALLSSTHNERELSRGGLFQAEKNGGWGGGGGRGGTSEPEPSSTPGVYEKKKKKDMKK